MWFTKVMINYFTIIVNLNVSVDSLWMRAIDSLTAVS